MKRLFAAIKVDSQPGLTAAFSDMKVALGAQRIKWVDLQNLHLTLKFFGETPDDKIPEITALLAKVCDRHRAFSCEVAGCGLFGSRYQPRVIWLGFDQDEPLKALGLDILHSCGEIGFPPDRQNFVPHLTLGRINEIYSKHLLDEIITEYHDESFQYLDVNEVILFESHLTSDGPFYEIIQKFPLKAF